MRPRSNYIARLIELYHAYEEYNDELALLDPNDTHQSEFEKIQARFCKRMYFVWINLYFQARTMREPRLEIANKGRSGGEEGRASDEVRLVRTAVASESIKIVLIKKIKPSLLTKSEVGSESSIQDRHIRKLTAMLCAQRKLNNGEKYHEV